MTWLRGQPLRDAAPARWIVEAIEPFGTGVHALVPRAFEAYARVFHPAESAAGEPVRWAEIARAHGTVLHPLAQFGSLTGVAGYEPESTRPDVWDRPPGCGTLDRVVATRLAAVLGRFTGTGERCWFAIWDGYGQLPVSWMGNAGKVQLPERAHHLFSGALTEVERSFDDWWDDGIPRQGRSTVVSEYRGPVTAEPAPIAPVDERYQGPSLWWPDDHSWCVATDVDLNSTYLGGSRACIDAVTADRGLEACEIPAGAGIDWASDTVNPRPA